MPTYPTYELAVATEDGSATAVLASGVTKFRAVGHALYVTKAVDQSLWRIDVPQP